MFSLLLSTFAMMGLTFVIGFFVAGVIKLIASAADSLAFYSSHLGRIGPAEAYSETASESSYVNN